MEVEAIEALRTWLKESNVTLVKFAAAVGVTHAAVSEWLRGAYRPNAITQLKIERYTLGKVSQKQWLTKQERESIKSVVPWSDL